MLDRNSAPMLADPSDPWGFLLHIIKIKWDGTRVILFLNGQEYPPAIPAVCGQDTRGRR
ncbi:MAG TPA: hypothetical protein VF336_02460 [Syntrophales bacterium]